MHLGSYSHEYTEAHGIMTDLIETQELGNSWLEIFFFSAFEFVKET
jgi:hypothetical protein